VNYRNAQAVGIRYEKAVGSAARDLKWGKVLCGQWFEFSDWNGAGYCQTDVLIVRQFDVIVLECKLTEVLDARIQLEDLYLPVVEKVFDRLARGVVVARHLTKTTNTDRVFDNLPAALLAGHCPILHWIGRGPIGHTPPVEPRMTLDEALRRSAS
jgi:hypothetical protein